MQEFSEQTTGPLKFESLQRERLKRAGSLHWFHYVVVGLSLLLTFGAWSAAKSQVDEKQSERFDRDSAQMLDLIVERMQKYEDALLAGVAHIQARNGDLDYQDWKTYSQSLAIDARYPGINGIGIIDAVHRRDLQSYLEARRRNRPDFTVHPEHPGDYLLPIVFVEPLALNAKAVGLDIAHERSRFIAALQARDTGLSQITGPITLVQDNGRTPGFLFYSPYYKGLHNTQLERRANFEALVYAPFVFNKLMEGALHKGNRNVGLQVRDGSETLYDEHVASEEDFDGEPLFSKKFSKTFYGRKWDFDLRSTQSFRQANRNDQPLSILIGAIIVDTLLLLLLLFLYLSRANRQALELADGMTKELRLQTLSLQQSNRALEQFAYAAAHDLKSPLRAIGSLSSWIGEDLPENVSEELVSNLDLLQRRVGRMDGLVDGLMSYALAGTVEERNKEVQVAKIVEEAIEDVDAPEAFQISIEGELPAICTDPVLLRQVFANLIGNAVKHHCRSDGHVTVRSEKKEEIFEFSVEDDGPGIPPDVQEKIFVLFQTLKRKDEQEGSGIGLSVARKVVESHGGSISVSSDGKSGSRFVFSWPENSNNQNEAAA